jgi:hypothetical protein
LLGVGVSVGVLVGVGVSVGVLLGVGVSVGVLVGVGVSVGVLLGVGVSVGVLVGVGVGVGVTSSTITSSIAGPHAPPVLMLVKLSCVLETPAAGASDVPSVSAVQPMFVGLWPVVSNEKFWLTDPNDTITCLTLGEPNRPHANGFGWALPANAKVTEYTCPAWVGMFWDTELGLSEFRSTDWLPLLGSHPRLALLFSISVPAGPAIQGCAAELGNEVPALMVTKFAVPSDGSSKPQSFTRFAVNIEQFGCGAA